MEQIRFPRHSDLSLEHKTIDKSPKNPQHKKSFADSEVLIIGRLNVEGKTSVYLKDKLYMKFCVLFKRFRKHDVHCVQFEVNREQLAARYHTNCGRPRVCFVDSPIAKWGTKLATKATGQAAFLHKNRFIPVPETVQIAFIGFPIIEKNRTFLWRAVIFRIRKIETTRSLSAYKQCPEPCVHLWIL